MQLLSAILCSSKVLDDFLCNNVSHCPHLLCSVGTTGNPGPKSIALVGCMKSANVTDLYEIYGEFSEEIHGASWSGPSILVYRPRMSEVAFNFIKCLAASMSIDCEEIV